LGWPWGIPQDVNGVDGGQKREEEGRELHGGPPAMEAQNRTLNPGNISVTKGRE
jgi:hypothetical protein